jgi:acetyl-CoA C-acetyltransferase
MEKVYIVSACRTAIGNFGGSLKDISAAKLGEIVLKEAILRAGVSAGDIDEVIMGNVLQAGLGQNTARQAAVNSGLPVTVPSYTINKVCSSGLKSVSLAAQSIMLGEAECVLAGGMENMSQAPYLLKQNRWGAKMGDGVVEDSMIKDGLWDVFNNYHMGITAENIAEKYGITRLEQDEFAVASQFKSECAQKEGRFKEEIVPVEIPRKKQEPIIFSEDEYIKGSSIEKLSTLRPAFKNDGTVTAGNASGINDGAAVVLLAGEKYLKNMGIAPMARVLSSGSVGVDPSIMGMGPVPSSRKALEKAGISLDSLGLVEANEAFAVQSIAVMKELGLKSAIVNVNGGAIALGHPIGASGARILVTLLYEMKRRNEEYGLATLCIGGGMGEALIVKRDSFCKQGD